MKIKFVYPYLIFTAILTCFAACKNASDTNIVQEQDSVEVEQIEPVNKSTLDLSEGKKIYDAKCRVCHLEEGQGIPGNFPPLANSDFIKADKYRALQQAIYGSKVPITVNGIEYPGNMMTILELNDEQVRDVVNYILNSWGNNLGVVTIEDVKAARKQ